MRYSEYGYKTDIEFLCYYCALMSIIVKSVLMMLWVFLSSCSCALSISSFKEYDLEELR